MLPNQRTTREEVAASPRAVEGLVVSPNRDSSRPMLEFLRAEGVNVQSVISAELGFEEALLHRPYVVLIDERISKAGGVDLCGRLKSNPRTHFLPVILVRHGRASDLLPRRPAPARMRCSPPPPARPSVGLACGRCFVRRRSFAGWMARRQLQSNAISDKRRWVRGLVHDIQNSLGAIQANFEYVAQQSEPRDKRCGPSLRSASGKRAGPSARSSGTCAPCSSTNGSRRATSR